MELNRSIKGKCSAIQEGNHVKTCTEAYRCCQVHTDAFNRVFGSLNADLHTTVVTIITLSVYCTMRTSWLFAVFTTYFACVCLVFYLSVANSYSETIRVSRTLLQSLKQVGSNGNVATGRGQKITNRRIQALRELRIHAGPVFFYDKQLVLTTVEIILVQSVNLLVAY